MSWPRKNLAEIALINPRRPLFERDDAQMTTFVSMEVVDDVRGEVSQCISRPYSVVKKGYTYFEEGDVIFAKITPCMQNGKHAIVSNLIEGFGFGSTEFHVIRPLEHALPEWIHYFLRRWETLDAAVKTFTGAVGQQRVPASFLEKLEIPLPPVDEQRQIATRLKAQLAEAETARQAAEVQLREVSSLGDAIILDSIRKAPTELHSLNDVLNEVKQGTTGKQWADYPVLGATRDGLAPSKEPPGKQAPIYKPAFPGTVFYNPMRILIGSIAFVDENDTPGITSPDYVALRDKADAVDSRWFYFWLRSPLGVQCINSLARGAVRERMLFNRLAEGEIELPCFDVQKKASLALKELKPLREAITNKLAEFELLPQKILAQAFGQ